MKIKKQKIICVVLSAAVCICAAFTACSGTDHSKNEKETELTQTVTNENGEVVGVTDVDTSETVTNKNGEVFVKKVETVTDKDGNKVTKVVTEKVTDKSGKSSSTTKKSSKTTTAKNKKDSSENDSTTKKSKKKKKKTTTTTDPVTTTRPDDPIQLPDIPEDGYALSTTLGHSTLQEYYGSKYIVNTISEDGDTAVYKIYYEKNHKLYSTVTANLKTGNATEVNEKTGKKTKYNITKLLEE